MITAVNMAKEAMGEELLQEVIDFHRKNDRGLPVGFWVGISDDDLSIEFKNITLVLFCSCGCGRFRV